MSIDFEPAEDGLLLDDQLCFALYAASRAVTARYRGLLDELGLTYPQYLVMLVLWEQEPITVGQLGQRLHLDSGTLSPLIKRLETQGLVHRVRRTDDERQVNLHLTTFGRTLRHRAIAVPVEIGQSTGLDPAARTRLAGQLNRLADSVTNDMVRRR